MSYDSSLITYTVSLHFSDVINEIIFKTVQDIAELTGDSFKIKNKIPPHLTIGAFRASKESEEKLIQMIKDFAGNQKACKVVFSELSDFKEKVLFLKPLKDEYLTELNQNLHKTMLTEFTEGENGYYLPDIWFPHTTLATRLNQRQFEKAVKLAQQIKLPLQAEIKSLSVYKRSQSVYKNIQTDNHSCLVLINIPFLKPYL